MIGLMATVLTAGYAIGQFVNGFLIDKHGARIMMTIGGILSTIANFGVGISSFFGGILTSWGINGYVQAFGYPSCCKLYSNWFPPEGRGKPLGFNESLQSFSSTIIVPLSAFIITIYGWRYVYFIPVIPMLAMSLIFYTLAKNKPADVGIDKHYGISEKKKTPRQAYKSALSDWRMVASYISYGGSQFGRFVIYTWVAKYIYELTGQIIVAGWVTAMFALGGTFGSLIVGWLSDIIKKRYPIIVVGMIISAVSLLVFALMPTAPIWILSLLMAICGTGIEAVETCYFLLPMDILDEEGVQATGVGVMNAFGKLFATFQGVAFGLLLDISGFKQAFLVTSIICFIAALLVIPIRK
jgi:OPA family glycerol-3-phosphate transporter-like MFS transporter